MIPTPPAPHTLFIYGTLMPGLRLAHEMAGAEPLGPAQVTGRLVDVGQYLQPGTPIVTLQSLDPIYADFYLPAQQANRIQVNQKAAVAVDADSAQTVAGTRGTGAWDDAQLLKRLVDAGLAPQKRDSVRAQPWMGVPVHAYQLGNATIDAYVYRDSTARKDATAKLDPVTFAPRGLPARHHLAERRSPRFCAFRWGQ